MRSLSKEAERKLISAIEKAAALVNDGEKPTAAIIKSARDHDIPSGHINLMVHAYNTGRTTTQREKGESTLEKAAEFPLADAGDVLKALYPETVKSSSAIKRAEAVSTEYALPVAGMLARRRDEMQKAAAAQIALPEKTWTPPPRDAHAAVMRAQSEKIATQRAEEETRRQATASYSKAASALDDLSVYFRTPGNMTFGDALREVNLRLGPRGVTVLEKVSAVYPHFAKQADTKKRHFGDDAVYGLVQTVLDSVSNYNEAQSRVVTKKSEAVCKKSAPKFLTGSILNDAVDPPLQLKAAERKGGPGTNPLGDHLGGNKGKSNGPLPPPKPLKTTPTGNTSPDEDAAESLPTNQKLDELNTRYEAVDNAPFDSPSFESVIDDMSFGEQLERNRADAPERNRARAQRDILEQAREFETNEQRTREEQQRLEDEKLQDALFNQSEVDRVQKERDMQYASRQKDEDDARAQEELAQADELAKKEKADKDYRQESWNKGKSIGEGIGKAFKGDFMGNATAPIKTIGGLLGAKSLADLSPIQKKDPNKIVREQYQQLTDPNHENALKTIRAKSILHDMVLNDPVISGYDPQDVAMAFNEIAELAPSLVDAPGMIRPLLRKRLESGQLADFDVKQILDMDKLRADRDKALMDTKEKTLNLL